MVYFTQSGITALMTIEEAMKLAQASIQNKFKFKMEYVVV